jgi:hypothetical protein
MQKQLLKINVSLLIRLELKLHMFHGFDTLGPYSREKDDDGDCTLADPNEL